MSESKRLVWDADTKRFYETGCDMGVLYPKTGATYGTLTDVSQTGANAVYHMATDKGEVLIPAIPDVIIEVDIKGDVLRLRPMKGLLDDDEI